MFRIEIYLLNMVRATRFLLILPFTHVAFSHYHCQTTRILLFCCHFTRSFLSPAVTDYAYFTDFCCSTRNFLSPSLPNYAYFMFCCHFTRNSLFTVVTGYACFMDCCHFTRKLSRELQTAACHCIPWAFDHHDKRRFFI